MFLRIFGFNFRVERGGNNLVFLLYCLSWEFFGTRLGMRITIVDGSSRVLVTTLNDSTCEAIVHVDSSTGRVLSTSAATISSSSVHGDDTSSTPLQALAEVTPPPHPTTSSNTAIAFSSSLLPSSIKFASDDHDASNPRRVGCTVEGCTCAVFESAVPHEPTICFCGHGQMYHNEASAPPSAATPQTSSASPILNGNDESGMAPPYPHQEGAVPPDATAAELQLYAQHEASMGDWYRCSDPGVAGRYYQKAFGAQMAALRRVCTDLRQCGATSARTDVALDDGVRTVCSLVARSRELAEKQSNIVS
eukprot:PhM_4_TR4884/c0_g2_i1/m.35305